MFLRNAPPVVALQSRWEAFGQPRSLCFPDCFSESKEDTSRASVSARVQTLVSMLQRDEDALGMSHERVTQRGQRAERSQDTRLAPKSAVCKEQPEFPVCGLVANCSTQEKDEAGRHGPLELDSDSDDSVVWDIEEAIQEYLKAKGGASEPMSQGVPSIPEPAHSCTLPILCPSKLTPGSGCAPVGASEDQGSTSPASMSSENSFEQSIWDEIEGPAFPLHPTLPLREECFLVGEGHKQAGLFSPSLGLPLQGPAFSTFRETHPGHSPVFGSPHLLMKDSGNWPSRKAQGILRHQDRRNSGSEDEVLDLRYQHRVDREQQDQETLGSDASEFRDTSMENGGSATVSSKGLKL